MAQHSHHPLRHPLRHRLPHAVTALILGLLVLAAPGTAHAENDTVPGKSWVRVGHFVPGMGTTSIDVEPLDGSSAPTTLAGTAKYGDVSTYEQLAPGSYTATVRETSAPADAAPLLSRSFDVTSSKARTIAVIGTSQAPRLAVLSDDLTLPAAGTARVRLLSAFEGADSVTVEAVDGPTIAEGAVLGQATAYATVPAGSWTLRLQSSTATASLQEVDVASGSVYTVVALDAANEGVELQVVIDAAGAMVAPKGGAATGGGGTATPQATATEVRGGREAGIAGLGAGLLAVLAAAGVLSGRRRAQVGR